MNIETMLTTAYRHFVHHCVGNGKNLEVSARYALEELKMNPATARNFYMQPILLDGQEPTDPEFSHFYTWYYLNYYPAIKKDFEWDCQFYHPEITAFTGIEVLPVKRFEEEGDEFCELCTVQEAEFWSIYLYRKSGGPCTLADCREKETADNICTLLLELIKNWEYKPVV